MKVIESNKKQCYFLQIFVLELVERNKLNNKYSNALSNYIVCELLKVKVFMRFDQLNQEADFEMREEVC